MNGRKLRFLTALLEESTVSKAAEKANISRQTAYNYLQDEEFQGELSKRKSEVVDQTIRYLQGKLSLCSETLVRIIEKPEASDQVKTNAINPIYANCKAMTDTAEIMAMSAQATEMAKWIEQQERKNR